ncbi:MAG: pilus assembly protein PilM [Planctomycetota bacterium]
MGARRKVFGGKQKNSEYPIGLDVGDGGIRLMQLALRGGQLTAVAAAHVRLPGESRSDGDAYHAEVTRAMGRALAAGGFTGHAVVSSLPASSLQCKNLRLPVMPADELASAVQWEAADRFGFGDRQTSAQFFVAGQVRQGEEERQEIILLAARLGFVERHVSSLTENNLRPKAIDAAPAALARLSGTWDDASEVHVTIDFGRSATKVLIVKAGKVVFYKPIDIGAAQLDSTVSGSLGISLDEARQRRENLDSAALKDRRDFASTLQPVVGDLGREIGLCLRYYGVTFRGPRPETGRLIGGAADKDLAESLGQASGLKLTLDGVLDGIDLSAVRETIKPGTERAWAVAAGLSLREHTRPKSAAAQTTNGAAA